MLARAFAAALAFLGVASAAPPAPRVSYSVACDPAAADPRLTVRLRATGLDPAQQPVTVHLPDHGEWTQLDALYLRVLSAHPPLEPIPDDPTRWTLQAPPDWDGSFDIAYTIPLVPRSSKVHERHGLLPWHAEGPGDSRRYAVILSTNTLSRIEITGRADPIPADITITPPPDLSVVTGWSGATAGEQRVSLEAGLDDSPIMIGVPRTARSDLEGAACEVAQFAGESDITAPVLAAAHSLAAAYAATTGHPLDRPLRIFITDKGGGQWTPRGLLLQAAHGGPDEAASPGFRLLLAHELFHQWLGGYANTADASLVWFQEGFTDYLALWHLAATGHVTREWFVDHLLELDAAARASPSCGAVAFGHAGAVWRDRDGPNEILAYRGGAVLAFCLDVELARRGGPRLPALIGDLARNGDGTYTLDDIRAWLEARGLAEFARDYIDHPGLPPIDDALLAIGFERIATDLSYTGLAVAPGVGSGIGTIAAIDPAGPAATSGFEVGDVIGGYWVCRTARPRIGRGVQTAFSFALDAFDPAAGEVTIGVHRGGRDLTLKLRPTPLPGGYFWRATGDPAAVAASFSLPPAAAAGIGRPSQESP